MKFRHLPTCGNLAPGATLFHATVPNSRSKYILSNISVLITHLTFICSRATVETLEKVCSKLTKTSERRHWRRSGIFIANYEHISHLISSASIVDFEQVNVSWVLILNRVLCWLLTCKWSLTKWILRVFVYYKYISLCNIANRSKFILSIPPCSFKKVLLKYAVNLQENT